MSQVRKCAAAGLDEAARRSRRRRMAVGGLDKTGQEKPCHRGRETPVHGLRGRVADGINTVHLSTCGRKRAAR